MSMSVGLTLTWFSKEMLISNIFICGFMCSAIKKSWKVSTTYVVNISLWILQVPRGFARDMFQTFQWKKALMRTKILMYKFSHKKMAKFQTFQWKKLLRTKILMYKLATKRWQNFSNDIRVSTKKFTIHLLNTCLIIV